MALLLAAMLSTLAASPAAFPDLILEGATVYESPDASSRKASVVLSGGRILFVGDSAAARAHAPSAQRIDLNGAFLFPGLADAHGHLEGLGKSLEIADLRGAEDAAEAARRVAAVAAKLPAGAWAEGRGWDQNHWPGMRFPDARDLDAAVPDRPAVARRVDGHALWVNSAVLKLIGVSSSTRDPEGGRLERRANGSPSGVFVDHAMTLVEDAMPPTSDADFTRRFLAAARACAEAGLTEVQDASAYPPEDIDRISRMAERGDLPIRVYATVSSDPALLEKAFARPVRIGSGNDFLTVRAIKSYADGALGSRGAALLADYSDDPGNRGLLLTPPDRLDALARQARERGWQLWVHAIGDRGNRTALDAYEKARAARAPAGGDRPRIEHAQVIDLSDIPRFAKEGVIASIQPTHATSDMPWAEQRVGPERIRGAYAWRQLIASGARLAGGSDFPVESQNPLLGFYAAVTRQDLSGKPAGGWRPQERLSRREALALFTTGAAYAAYEENRRGRVAAGFDADLTVLGKDPMVVREPEIPSIPVVLTVTGGRIVYGRGLSGGAHP